MLEMQWKLYEGLMKEIDLDYVEFAGLYALSKDDLIYKFQCYCRRNNKSHIWREFEEEKIEVDFIGEGYYDLCGFEYGVGMIMRIDATLKSQT